jgi:hypothetical protein
MSAATLRVVVVDTRTRVPQVHALTLTVGATVRDALSVAGLRIHTTPTTARAVSAADGAGRLDIGIFGQRCPPETVLREGDRVEVYRALDLDPQAARRRRAAARATARMRH